MSKPHKPYFTYFVQNPRTGAIKVGKSTRPGHRLKELQVGNPDRLRIVLTIEGDHERVIHDYFPSSRAEGEWFSGSRAIYDCIGFLQDPRREWDGRDFYSWKIQYRAKPVPVKTANGRKKPTRFFPR